MALSRKHMQGLGTGLQMGGIIARNLDSDNSGADDKFGQAFSTAGIALSQLAVGESPTKKGKAADALDAVGDACKSLAAELRAE